MRVRRSTVSALCGGTVIKSREESLDQAVIGMCPMETVYRGGQMRFRRRDFLFGGLGAASATRSFAAPPDSLMAPRFQPVQPELFGASGGQPNCWADFDSDGYPDLFVGFKADLPNRLYRNDGGRFVEVGADLKINDLSDTRGAAW